MCRDKHGELRMAAARVELVERLMRVAPKDGSVQPLAGVYVHRASQQTDLVHGITEPSFCVIAQGSKEIYLGGLRYRYDTANYLLAAAELPVTSRLVVASEEMPYLSVRISLDPAMVGSVMAEAEGTMEHCAGDMRALTVSSLDPCLLDATLRLVRLAEHPLGTRVLAPLTTREIVFRLLMGEQGSRLLYIAALGGYTNRIASTVHHIRCHFNEPLRIESLAKEAGMSISSFHQHFRAVTAMTPLQFQKQLRLQEARRLMLAEDVDAATAGYRVGYGDAAHFSREYKRLFGEPPIRDVSRFRDHSSVTGAASNTIGKVRWHGTNDEP